MDLALTNAGEVTNGNSPYEADLLNKLNRVHFTLCAGGTISLGKDTTVQIDETWPWAKARRPLVLELQPKYDTGTVTLTLASEAGSFSSAPAYSVEGWYVRLSGREAVYRIASHTASATAFELDAAYPEATTSTTFEVFKLDYDLTPDYIVIDAFSNKIDFKKTSGGSVLTATLTEGSYTPSALATHLGTQMTTAASGPTITCTYSALTKKFTITSDGAGSTTLLPLFATGTSQSISAHKVLGFDDVDEAAALSHVSVYIQGGIARLVEPFRLHLGCEGLLYGIDPESFMRAHSLHVITGGTPDAFCVIGEKPDGTLRIRLNRYVEDKARCEVDHVPAPRDLKDSAGSIPVVPRKHVDILEDAATFYVMLLKNDDRAPIYQNLVQGKLNAMIAQHRGSLVRSGQHFGQIISRLDNFRPRRNYFGNGY
jgi:hypothetical protein